MTNGRSQNAGAWRQGHALFCSLLLAAVCFVLLAACQDRDVPQRVSLLALEERRVSGSSGDSYNSASTNYPTSDRVLVGQAASDLTAGVRWPINVPRGSEIISATVSLNISATQGCGWSLKLSGEAADNCAGFSTSWPASRTLTSADVVWNIPSGTGWKTSPDIGALVAEVTSRAGWAAGNGFCLIITDNQANSGTYQMAYAYDSDTPANAAGLSIGYNAPTPTPTPTFTATPTPTRTPTATPTPTPVCGAVTTPVTWSGTVRVGCNLAVAQGVTLTLAPGSALQFLGPYKADVYGSLTALGLPASTITLTSGVSTTAGSWGPLFLLGEGSALNHVAVLYGTAVEVAAPLTLTYLTAVSNTLGVDFLAAGALLSSTVQGNGTGILVRQNVLPTLEAVNIVSNTIGLWNAQALTLTVPGLWWGSTLTATIEAALRDQGDDYRLGRVEWWPAAAAPW